MLMFECKSINYLSSTQYLKLGIKVGTTAVIVRRFVWRRSIFHHPTSSVFNFFSYFCIIFLDVISMPCYLYI